MSSVLAGAAVVAAGKKSLDLGLEAFNKIMTLATTPEGMAYIGRLLEDKQAALDVKIAMMKEAPDPKVAP